MPLLPALPASSLAAASGAVDAAHVVHYGIVFAGLVGLGLLLVPAYAGRWLPATGVADAHEVRVQELRRRASAGTLTLCAAPPAAPPATPTAAVRAVALPVALVGSLAAAGAHAAVGPQHAQEGLLVGAFFTVVALGQVAWAGALWSAPGPRVLVTGVVGNLGVLATWAASRTVGVPGVDPEPVGAWDLACAVWEVALVVACLRLLARPSVPRQPWHPLATAWLAASLVLLGILSVSGAAA